ncbi:hypothetical protein TWF696_002347 [Orbilia brochopaga]|uniref:Phospholipase/carboxylesterase/thioesterase domain-containing protein n=1 Tax=Orbilia brochopaga TaxID=3140254 RepID=A0AAV9U7X4_9PEZI
MATTPDPATPDFDAIPDLAAPGSDAARTPDADPNPSFPEPHVINPTSDHTHTIIILHGKGSNAEILVKALLEAKSSDEPNKSIFECFPNIRWVFPNARRISTTPDTNQGVYEWFPMAGYQNPLEEEESQKPEMRNTIHYINGLLTAELATVNGDTTKIILGGVCQGLAAALALFLALGHTFGGFIGISGWLPRAKQFSASTSHLKSPPINYFIDYFELELEHPTEEAYLSHRNARSKVPIFLGHGQDDGHIHVCFGHEAADLLGELGYNVTIKTYVGGEEDGHWLKLPEEMDAIKRFIESITK